MSNWKYFLFTTFLACLLSACSSSPASRFYLLEPTASVSDPGDANGENILVVIDSIRIADYLDRPQIVSLGKEGRVFFSKRDYWGEPLENGFRRILAENLNRMSGGKIIVPWAKTSNMPVDLRMTIDIIRFEVDQDNTARLVARWSLTSPRRNTQFSQRTSLQLPLEGTTTGAEVKGLNTLLVEYAHEVKAKILLSAD